MISGREAVAAVPRELFVPETIYVASARTGWLVPLRRADDPERWRAHVRDDRPVVTAVAFDPRVPPEARDSATGRGCVSTSSSSAPHVVARMIDALELQPDLRVLEVGTGSGHTAAVLAHMLGGPNVTSVEVDADLAAKARSALARAGYPVVVVTGDGAEGYPPGAPYDRIIATAAVRALPYAWVTQTRPGGRILAPWAATFHPDAPLGLLTVGPNGTAQGRFLAPGHFMPLRHRDTPRQADHDPQEGWVAAGKPECTRFGITVTPDSQHIWLDRPERHVASL